MILFGVMIWIWITHPLYCGSGLWSCFGSVVFTVLALPRCNFPVEAKHFLISKNTSHVSCLFIYFLNFSLSFFQLFLLLLRCSVITKGNENISLISGHENYQPWFRFRLFFWQCKKGEKGKSEWMKWGFDARAAMWKPAGFYHDSQIRIPNFFVFLLTFTAVSFSLIWLSLAIPPISKLLQLFNWVSVLQF